MTAILPWPSLSRLPLFPGGLWRDNTRMAPPLRKIIHIDMDSFYASVEVRENPSLAGKPVAVGGSTGGRGVVATCSYEARQYGVHSAMPMARALRLCPELIVLPVNMPLYREVSSRVMAIFRHYTTRIEPLSLDEAFLDVSHCDACQGSATRMAEDIRQRIFAQEKLTASAGIAPNKFLAKVASDWHKPNGQKVITPPQVAEFVRRLPVKKIPGVGRVTAAKLASLGIETCAQLQKFPLIELQHHFGVFGLRLHELAHGRDERPVVSQRQRKSLSMEDTFAIDLPDFPACQKELRRLYLVFLQRLHAHQQKFPQQAIGSRHVKLRFADFYTTTVQRRGQDIGLTDFDRLLKTAWLRGQREVRLIGLGVSFEPNRRSAQLGLFN